MHELNATEIDAVAGGWTVVGNLTSTFTSGVGWSFDGGTSSLVQDIDRMEPTYGMNNKNLVDTDGDGVPDSPEIVVTSPLSLSQIREASQYADFQAAMSYWEASLIGAIATKDLNFWAGFAIGGVSGSPPVSDTVIEANADFLFASIVAYGGLHNYLSSAPTSYAQQ